MKACVVSVILAVLLEEADIFRLSACILYIVRVFSAMMKTWTADIR